MIISEIEDFLSSDEEVLLLEAPPGSAKSSYVSVLLPPWYLANNPTHSILAATHASPFAWRWGRRIRNDIAEDEAVLGLRLAEDSKAADRWALTSGGEYYGVGAGVGISGFRADLGIGDDFYGSREDAYSETVRTKRWDWYLNDFSSRLRPGAKRILMNTRWHEEDIPGLVKKQIERGDVKGRIITLRAVAEEDDILGRQPGEYLWDEPSGYNYGAFLRQRRKETSPMMWAALYQQRPAPEEGDFFKAEWLRPYETLPDPKTLRIYGASDYAVTADGGDYTVHIIVGVDAEGRMYLLDLWRKQASSDQWVEAFCDLVLQWKPLEWAEETGQIKAGVGPFLDRRQNDRGAYVYRRAFPTKRDKAVRAQSIRGRMALRGLYVPIHAPWYPAFKSELLTCWAGKNDDQADALGLIGQLLDTILEADRPTTTHRELDDGYREVSSEYDDSMDMMIT